jgi:hypothetical protein
MDYNDKKLITNVIVAELADIDPLSLKWGEWLKDILPQAARRLSYYLEQDVYPLALEGLVDTLEQIIHLEDQGFESHEAPLTKWLEQYEEELNSLLGGE